MVKRKRGLFNAIRYAKTGTKGEGLHTDRAELGKLNKAGLYTPEELLAGVGGAATVDVQKLGVLPTASHGPARRREAKGYRTNARKD